MAPRGPAGSRRRGRRRRRKDRGRDRFPESGPHTERDVATLALVAAIATAVLPFLAAWLSARADGGWQRALRQELTRSTAMIEDVRFVYTDQAPDVFRVDLADARVAALRRVAAERPGLPGAVANAEARVELDLAFRTRQRLGLRPDQERGYRRPDGSFDLGRRLADVRNLHPRLVRVDPEPQQEAGDRAGRQAGWVAVATVPVAAAFIMAAVAYWEGTRRRPSPSRLQGLPLLQVGYGLLGVAGLMTFWGVLA